MWAGSQAARAKISVSGAPTCLIDCNVFIADNTFCKCGTGRGLETRAVLCSAYRHSLYALQNQGLALVL